MCSSDLAGRGQELSALGIPLTADAWARQDAVDAGMLHVLYLDVLQRRMDTAHADRSMLAKLDLLDAMPGDVGEQVALVSAYLDLAMATPDASMILEFLPTDTRAEAVGRNAGHTLLETLAGAQPRTFRVSANLDKIRIYARGLSELLQRRGRTPFALALPYANTVENIVARVARPGDGVEVLQQYLSRIGGQDSSVETTAFGYSQGAAVVREYLARYGDHDGLDYAISVATMGGVDGAGADGIWAGQQGATLALSVVHADDPARDVHGRSALALSPALAAFVAGGDTRALHQCYFGAPCGPLPPGKIGRAHV